MDKLLDVQRNAGISKYTGKIAKVIIQDVRTRWWSTYRMIERLEYLAEALGSLIGARLVDCEGLSAEDWAILAQIRITLSTMARWQMILEGQNYVTSSLVAFAVWQIRRSYVTMIEEEMTLEPVRHLAKVLLEDFDQRYHPEVDGMVMYLRKATTGKGNRYVTAHHFLFFASFLDPRTKNRLKQIMTEVNYAELRARILDLMVEELDFQGARQQQSNAGSEDASIQLPASKRRRGDTSDCIYDELMLEFAAVDAAPCVASNRTRCELELQSFCHNSVGMPFKDTEGEFQDPLGWWKEKEPTYPNLAKLAIEYLAIPATSAPSERIWSRSANMLSIRRSLMNPEIASRMMFVRENAAILHKHYVALTGEPLSEAYLPIIEEDDIDVGK